MSKPSNFIQWKGTDVCMDFYCECGCHSHLDVEFCYFVRCPRCKQVWEMGTEVSMKKVKQGTNASCVQEGFE